MDLIKKLTSKNQSDYEQAAAHIINNADVESFEELISKDDFLFDFVKQNVSKRLSHACNENNFKNLLRFLKFYSPSYDEFIAKTLAKFADEEVHTQMFELLKNGTDEEKSYAAKYFSFNQDDKAIEELKQNAYSEFEPLALNCAKALSDMGERSSIDKAIEKLNSDDDFEVLSAVKFISAYDEKDALDKIFDVMKKSSMSEYIACEIGFMESFLDLLDSNHDNALLALNNIIEGLGEIVPVSNIFSFQLFEVFEKMIFSKPEPKNAIVLLRAKNKFNQLTENDEYLFDEDKQTKEEVNEIKKLLNSNINDNLDNFILEELDENSDFVYSAIELIQNFELLKPLLGSKNQTVLLKTLETLKTFGTLTQQDKDLALKNVTSEDIKSIIIAL